MMVCLGIGLYLFGVLLLLIACGTGEQFWALRLCFGSGACVILGYILVRIGAGR